MSTLDKTGHSDNVFYKVTVTQGQAMHVTDPLRDGYTLCGLRWWFECDHGADYCKKCQRILFLRTKDIE